MEQMTPYPHIVELLRTTGPNSEPQKRFFEAEARHIAYGGARGGGKSWAMRRKFVMLAIRYPGLKILLMRRTFPELQGNHINFLLSDLTGYAGYNDTNKVFMFPNGSVIKLGYCAAESDVYQYQGQEFDVIGLEEATHFTDSQRAFMTTCNRTTRSDFTPRMYYTANPGNVGHEWFKRLFIDRLYQGKEKAENYVFIPANVYDNPAIMKNNPTYVEELENLPEDLKRAHLYGDWDVFAGQYFRNFDRNEHVIAPRALPPEWIRFRSMDYGLDCCCCLWWAVDTRGTCYIYREMWEPNLILGDAARRIIELTPPEEKIRYTVASPDLWNRRQDRGLSGVELMSKAGLTGLIKADASRIPGWRAIAEYLALRKTGETDENGEDVLAPGVRIFSSCLHLASDLPKLQHDQRDIEDVSSEPHEITHAPEAMRYGIMSRPTRTPEADRHKYNFEFEKPKPKRGAIPGKNFIEY
jgi:phage terminase large subunit